MKKFEQLTKYIPLIQNDDLGEWIRDTENDGTPGRPICMPFVEYSQVVISFIRDLYNFCEAHPEYEHTQYMETLEAKGLGFGTGPTEPVEVSVLDDKSVIALLIFVVRGDRFCEGMLLGSFQDGYILELLQRLKAIDEVNDCQERK